MKAPKYQRMDALSATIWTAGHELADPIEGLQVTRDGIVVWAAGRAVLIRDHWDQSYGSRGEPLLGSGNWVAEYVRDCDPPALSPSAPRRPWWRIW